MLDKTLELGCGRGRLYWRNRCRNSGLIDGHKTAAPRVKRVKEPVDERVDKTGETFLSAHLRPKAQQGNYVLPRTQLRWRSMRRSRSCSPGSCRPQRRKLH